MSDGFLEVPDNLRDFKWEITCESKPKEGMSWWVVPKDHSPHVRIRAVGGQQDAIKITQFLNNTNLEVFVNEHNICPCCYQSAMLPLEDAMKERIELLEQQNKMLKRKLGIKEVRSRKSIISTIEKPKEDKGFL